VFRRPRRLVVPARLRDRLVAGGDDEERL